MAKTERGGRWKAGQDEAPVSGDNGLDAIADRIESAQAAAVAESGAAIEDAAIMQPEHLGRCTGCDFGVRFRSLPSGAGFTLVGSEAALGIGEHGRPMCPNGHGEIEIADDKIPAAEAIGQVADRLAAAEQPKLFETAPLFNADGAYMTLEEMAVEAQRLRDIADDDAAVAKKSKKAADDASDRHLVASLEFRRRRLQKVAAAEAAGDAPDPVDLYAVVKAAGQILLPGTIEGWSDEERAAVAGWTTTPERERPAVLGTPHVAPNGHISESDFIGDGPAVNYQECTVCHARIWHGYETGPMYDTGAKIGTDCPGPDVAHHYPAKTRKKRTRGAAAEPTASPESDAAGDPPHESDSDEVVEPASALAGDEATE